MLVDIAYHKFTQLHEEIRGGTWTTAVLKDEQPAKPLTGHRSLDRFRNEQELPPAANLIEFGAFVRPMDGCFPVIHWRFVAIRDSMGIWRVWLHGRLRSGWGSSHFR